MKLRMIFSLILISFFMSAQAHALTAGDPAPDFAAKNQDGNTVQLSDFKGRPVLIYFYPKDDTPGCTKEACSFRDEYAKFKALGAVVLGVSRQDEASHRAFRAKNHLPFDLLADKDGKLAEAFGIGSIPVVGLLKRQSVLIGADGRIIRIYPDVDPSTHTATVIGDLQNYALHSGKRKA